jgi:hypothetical protein
VIHGQMLIDMVVVECEPTVDAVVAESEHSKQGGLVFLVVEFDHILFGFL